MDPLPPMRPPGPSMSPDMYSSQQFVNIEKPTQSDVLCGRGVTTNRHVGNENFRSLVNCNKELYVSSTKKEKMRISRSIVEAVRSLDPPGRFLEKDQNTQTWFDIGDKKAVEKTSQALRDGAAGLRKQLSEDLNDPDFLSVVFDMDVVPEEKKTPVPKKDPKKTPVKRGHRRTKSSPTVGTVAGGKIPGGKRVSIDKLPMSPRGSVTYAHGTRPPMSPMMSSRSNPSSPRVYLPPPSRIMGPPVHRRIHSNSSVPFVGSSTPPSPGGQGHYPYQRRGPPYRRAHSVRHAGSPIYPENAEHRYSPLSHQHPSPYGPSMPLYPPSPSLKPPTSPYPPSHSMPPPQSMPPPPSPHPPRIYSTPLSPKFSPAYGRSPHPYGPPPEYRSPEYHPPPASPRSYAPGSRFYPPPPASSPHLSVPTLGGEHPPMRHPLPMSPARFPPPSPRSSRYRHPAEVPVEFSPPTTSSRRTPSPSFQAPLPVMANVRRENIGVDVFQPPAPRIIKRQIDVKSLDVEKLGRPGKENDKMIPFDENMGVQGKEVPNKVTSRSIAATEEVTSSPREQSPSAVVDVAEHEQSNKKPHDIEDKGIEEEFPYDEELVVSPLSLDKEDPTTLMELPENILTLPISPCGPHDGSSPGDKREEITA